MYHVYEHLSSIIWSSIIRKTGVGGGGGVDRDENTCSQTKSKIRFQLFLENHQYNLYLHQEERQSLCQGTR